MQVKTTASDLDIEMGSERTQARSVGLELRFTDIEYTATGLHGKRTKILNKVAGICHPGRFLAIMGASGAGKTSLIDILAGHIEKGVTGKLLKNGNPYRPADLRKQSCYVLQRDVLLATATVREAISTAASLRLSRQISKEKKLERIDAVISQLELERCADTLIGFDVGSKKGISGGERRRVSVALGLITDPQLVLLDEPTSGLDSETAVQLVECLVKLARADKTVVASIHQPNSLITEKFDDLMLLSHGQVLFSGPWQQSVPFFASAGFQCPVFTNPSDYFLAVAHRSSDILVEHWKNFSSPYLPISSDGSDDLLVTSESAAGLLHSKDNSMKSTIADGNQATWKDSYGKTEHASSWLSQVCILLTRSARTWYRTPSLFIGLIAQYMFSGIFLGLIYLQLGTEKTSVVFDRQASLFLVLVMLAFTPSATATTIYDSERALLRRESNSGLYKLSTYWATKTLITLPIQMLLTIIYSVLVYFLIGYRMSAGHFFIFLVTCFVYQVITETLGTLAAIVTTEATTAFLLVSCLLWVLVAFSGFLIKNTPVYMRWLPKISFVTFAYSLLYQNEFNGLVLHLTGSGDDSQPNQGISLNLGSSDLQFQCTQDTNLGKSGTRGPGGNNMTRAENLGTLVAIAIALRVIGYLLLRLQFALKRL